VAIRLNGPQASAKPETRKNLQIASIDKLDPPSYLSGSPASRVQYGAAVKPAHFDFIALKQTQIGSEVGVGSVAWGPRPRGGASHPLSRALKKRVDRERALNVHLGS
jgi:hypothetical protein